MSFVPHAMERVSSVIAEFFAVLARRVAAPVFAPFFRFCAGTIRVAAIEVYSGLGCS